jgi:nucleoside-diphosphate-sugar epimerase
VRAALYAGAEVRAICVKEPWRLQDVEHHAGFSADLAAGKSWWEAGAQAGLARLLVGADALALLAYRPPTSRAEPARARHELEVNAEGTRRVAETAFRAGVRVAFASSADVYGPSYGRRVSERDEPRPVTPYARAKLATERLLAEASPDGSAVLNLRIATVFGPGENGPRAIPSFVRALSRGQQPVVHGDGTDVRDYVHVGDVAAAIVNGCVAADGARGELSAVNLGSGIGRTTNEILRHVAAAMGVAPIARFEAGGGRRTQLVLEIEKASRLLGLRPRGDFESALSEEVAWLTKRRST